MSPRRSQTKMLIERAERLRLLPPYLFVELDRRKRQAADEGIDLIDLGIGDPELPTPRRIVDTLRREALRPGRQAQATRRGDQPDGQPPPLERVPRLRSRELRRRTVPVSEPGTADRGGAGVLERALAGRAGPAVRRPNHSVKLSARDILDLRFTGPRPLLVQGALLDTANDWPLLVGVESTSGGLPHLLRMERNRRRQTKQPTVDR